MKNKPLTSLLAAGFALISWAACAQSTPAGASTSPSSPQGAIVTDSLPAQKGARKNSRMNKRANRSTDAAVGEEKKYRQSSSSNGTSINNSNSTNYNSNNATNAPTGVGSASDTTKSSTTKPPRR